MGIELFCVVVEHEKYVGLATNHVAEIAVASCAVELATNHLNVVFRRNRLELRHDVIADVLGGFKNSTSEFGVVVPAERQRREPSSRQQAVNLDYGITHRLRDASVQRRITHVVRAALFVCAGRYACGAPVRFALKRTNDRVATPWRTSVPLAPKSVAIHGATTLTGGCCIVRSW